MPDWVRYKVCEECGQKTARMQVAGLVLCDRCADRYISRQTGYPTLPDPPPPEEIVGPDGVPHLMSYRLIRGAAGVTATAEEERPVDEGRGYEFRILASHDANPSRLINALRVRVRQEVGALYLTPQPAGRGWLLEKDEAVGRLVWNEQQGKPYNVVVDGRTLSWEEFGNALERFEGYRFRLEIFPMESLDEDDGG